MHNFEPATKPEDLARFFVERANSGDVEGLVDLYEPDAVLRNYGEITVTVHLIIWILCVCKDRHNKLSVIPVTSL